MPHTIPVNHPARPTRSNREWDLTFSRVIRRGHSWSFPGRAFYKDGRLRETTFIVEAMLRSKCSRIGGITSGHCHDPHPSDAASNPTGLKFPQRTESPLHAMS